jgi:hypothetical protein
VEVRLIFKLPDQKLKFVGSCYTLWWFLFHVRKIFGEICGCRGLTLSPACTKLCLCCISRLSNPVSRADSFSIAMRSWLSQKRHVRSILGYSPSSFEKF